MVFRSAPAAHPRPCTTSTFGHSDGGGARLRDDDATSSDGEMWRCEQLDGVRFNFPSNPRTKWTIPTQGKLELDLLFISKGTENEKPADPEDFRELYKVMSENGKPSGFGKTAAHGKHMDEKRSRDVHWKEEEDLLQRRVISFPQRLFKIVVAPLRIRRSAPHRSAPTSAASLRTVDKIQTYRH